MSPNATASLPRNRLAEHEEQSDHEPPDVVHGNADDGHHGDSGGRDDHRGKWIQKLTHDASLSQSRVGLSLSGGEAAVKAAARSGVTHWASRLVMKPDRA
ncbi:MAG: hypothetical protein NTV92_07585 [Candidatus Bipolaricaulota bacterium]|nr:hypothetical protein [Candidatus Bipolaricaulota bacterium]